MTVQMRLRKRVRARMQRTEISSPPQASPPATQNYPVRLLRESERPRHTLKRRLKEVARRLEAGKASYVDIAMPWRRPGGCGTVEAID